MLRKLSPATAGTRRLALRYGRALVCVRYREDAARGRRLTTVELIVDETELRKQVQAAGSIGDGQEKLWRVPQAVMRKLKLQNRVVTEKAWIWPSPHIHTWQRFSISRQKRPDMDIS